uniref:Roc domain-containing protein n=1 Tax=Xenopus tropicalis TaxID=8364 RepID=A0A803JUL7_XENTR
CPISPTRKRFHQNHNIITPLQHGNTPLHYAAHDNNHSLVKELLDNGCDVLAKNGSGLTPMHFAALGDNVGILQLLLSRAPQAVNQKSIKGYTLLHEAVRGKSIKAIQFLIDKADPNLQDQEGNTPLHMAASLRPAGTAVQISQILLHHHRTKPEIQNLAHENFLFSIVRGAAMKASESSSNLLSLGLHFHPDILCRNAEGLTLLDVARHIQSPDCIIRRIEKETQEQQRKFLPKNSMQLPLQSPNPHLSLLSLEGPVKTPRGTGKKVKVFVCGHRGVGKSTLVRTLKETGLFSELQFPPSSKGVSITHADLDGDTLIMWDFAGQMECYFTRSLLLATSGASTMYCVVFSLEGVESDFQEGQKRAVEQIIYWLRFLSATKNVSPKPCVLLIGSHLDRLPENNREDIANCFFRNVMENHAELFQFFHITFLPINCKCPTSVQPAKRALRETVTQTPQVTQEHILGQQLYTVLFQCWNEFADPIDKHPAKHLSPSDLRAALEHLHNFSQLLYLPQIPCPSGTSSTGCVHRPSVQPDSSPSGLIIFNMKWFLQDICGTFGHYSLSPASGREKEQWSLDEMKCALDLKACDGNSEMTLKLLEKLELLFPTTKEEYVVPAWLKRGRPPGVVQLEKVRGIGYCWEKTSTGLFSQFFVGCLQIYLLRMFEPERCQLWREGAKLSDKAQLTLEVSENKRCLYMIGSWSQDCYEGDCYTLMEKVEKEVEKMLNMEPIKSWKKLHLIPRELHLIGEASPFEKLSGFTWEQILQAEQENRALCGKSQEVRSWEILFPHHDQRMLHEQGTSCSTHWLAESTHKKLCESLDSQHPMGLDWRRLAELLGGATTSLVLEINEESKRRELSPTCLVLDKYPGSIEHLLGALNQMGREDCIVEIELMLKHVCP